MSYFPFQKRYFLSFLSSWVYHSLSIRDWFFFFLICSAGFTVLTCLLGELSHSLKPDQNARWLDRCLVVLLESPHVLLRRRLHSAIRWSRCPREWRESQPHGWTAQFLFCGDEAVEWGASLLLLGFNSSWPTVQLQWFLDLVAPIKSECLGQRTQPSILWKALNDFIMRAGLRITAFSVAVNGFLLEATALEASPPADFSLHPPE